MRTMGTGNERWARVVGGLGEWGGWVCEWVVGRCVISEADPADGQRAAERRVKEDGATRRDGEERARQTVSNNPNWSHVSATLQ